MVFFIKRKRLRSSRQPDEKKRTATPHHNKILLLILLFGLIASNLFLLRQLTKSHKTVTQQQQVLMSIQEPADASSELFGKWYGLCGKNGIHSMQDFRSTVEKDPVLAAHFLDLNWENARLGNLEQAVWTHMAYRKGDTISTTRRVIRLPKGDGYITDGKRRLRTYCCNDYVLASPAEEVASAERMTPETSELVEGPDRQRLTDKEIHEILVVPEPLPLLLLGTGILLLCLRTRFSPRPNKRVPFP